MSKKNQAELTVKQRRFAEEYCVNLNATAAYIRAGYSARGNSAEAAASRLLSNVKVLKVIEEKQKEIVTRCDLTAEKVIREVAALAFFDVRKLFHVNGSLKSIHELDDKTAAAISSVEIDQAGVRKIKVWDKNSAQERLCKHLGLFKKDNSQKPNMEQNITVSFVCAGDKSDTNDI